MTEEKVTKRRGRPKIERINGKEFLENNPATRERLRKLSMSFTDEVRTVMDKAKVDAKVYVSFEFFPRN
jgi:hypothetical protein